MVLVTGASGFLGRRLVAHLSAQNEPVRALFNRHPPSAALSALPGVEWRKVDLLDVFDVEEVLKGVTKIYHCAAIVSYDPARRAELIHFNTESTANIVNEALCQGDSKMVYVSSIAAIGRSGIADKEMTEDEEWGESKYNSAYAISKYLAETEVWRGIGEGLDAVIVNPGIMLGACEDYDPPAQLLRLARHEFPFYTMGVTSWVDVDDVVAAMVALMNSGTTAERFIVSGGNFSFREIVGAMATALGKKPPYIRAGAFLNGLAWRWSMLKSRFTAKAPLLTRETAMSASMITMYNNEKLVRALNDFTYKPLQKSVEEMVGAVE